MMKSSLYVAAILLALTPLAQGCAHWVSSTAAAPLGPTGSFDKPVEATWGSYKNQDPPAYFCSCGNYTGALWNAVNTAGSGWMCWYSNPSGTPGYRSTSCSVGVYKVLHSGFAYAAPKIENSTASFPVPSGSFPGPLAGKDYSCVMNEASNIQGVTGAIPGQLWIDPESHNYVCQAVYPSKIDYRNTVSETAIAGKFGVVVAPSC